MLSKLFDFGRDAAALGALEALWGLAFLLSATVLVAVLARKGWLPTRNSGWSLTPRSLWLAVVLLLVLIQVIGGTIWMWTFIRGE